MFPIIPLGMYGVGIMAHGLHTRLSVRIREIDLHDVEPRESPGERLRMRRHVGTGKRYHVRSFSRVYGVCRSGHGISHSDAARFDLDEAEIPLVRREAEDIRLPISDIHVSADDGIAALLQKTRRRVLTDLAKGAQILHHNDHLFRQANPRKDRR